MVYNQEIFISHSAGDWEVKVVVLGNLMLCEDSFSEDHFLLVTSHCRRAKKIFMSLLRVQGCVLSGCNS